MLALEGVLPYAFTSDEAVVERAQAIWLLFALMQPLNGAVFALDGILIGAGDGRFLMWSMVVAFVASASVTLATLAFDWGIVGACRRSSSSSASGSRLWGGGSPAADGWLRAGFGHRVHRVGRIQALTRALSRLRNGLSR